MPQLLLPLFTEEFTLINNLVGYEKRDKKVYYFNGQMPLFEHREDDRNSFRLACGMLCHNNWTRQHEIVSTFGISKASIRRWEKQYREQGAGGFFNGQPRRKPRVLTKEVVSKIENSLGRGEDLNEICKELGIKKNTVAKAIKSGRIELKKK